jgi:hypothetical protein
LIIYKGLFQYAGELIIAEYTFYSLPLYADIWWEPPQTRMKCGISANKKTPGPKKGKPCPISLWEYSTIAGVFPAKYGDFVNFFIPAP